MSFPRKKVKWSSNKDIEFSAIDWIECDEPIYNNEVKPEDYDEQFDKLHNKFYTIFVFGVTEEGYSVCLKIKNYQPYFYIKLPDLLIKNDALKEKFNNEFLFKETLNFSKINKSENIYNKKDDTSTYLIGLREKMEHREHKSSLLGDKTTEIKREIFWSFTNNTKYDFLKLNFQSKEGYHFYNSFFKYNKHFPNMIDKRNNNKSYRLDFKLFESELEPILRFFHDTKVKPSGWIKLDKLKYKMKPGMSSCQINIEADYKSIVPIEKGVIPPLIVASYDIEADSSHGDFPLAKKDYKKLANQLVVSYLNKKIKMNKLQKSSPEYKIISDELKDFNFFKKRIIQAFDIESIYYKKQKSSQLSTDDDDDDDDDDTHLTKKVDDDISQVFFKKKDIKSSKDNKIVIERFLKSEEFNLLCKDCLFICNRPIKKIIANQKMKAAIIEVNIRYEKREEYYFKKDRYNPKQCNINDLISIIKDISKKTKIPFEELKTKILAKDVLVKYVNQELKKFFPQVKGDKVIQIGTVFWRYGDDKPLYNNMITLKDTTDIPGVDVYNYNKESQVLLEWTNMIRNYDPDIILGYNIFGFDEIFMYDRANELIAKGDQKNKKYQTFINMGRLNLETYKNIWNCRGKLLKKKLVSSALGSNYLEYFNMPGRVQIDLLKSIQGGLTKLDSYKLDSVAEFYICGSIDKVGRDSETTDTSDYLEIGNIKELEVGNYIIITLKTGEKLENAKKFIIKEVDYDNNSIILADKIAKSMNVMSPRWGIAKDDVTPKQIFEFQKGTNAQRAIIAKYCIQDCALVVRLLKKLDTIVNNFGMSNVCLVPFSYIFMRGQGIKIFSLIINECSQNNFVLPTLEKVRELENDDEIDLTDTVLREEPSLVGLLNNDDNKDNYNASDNGFELNDNFNKIIINNNGFEGAIVLVPKPGIYFVPVCILDFSSLYPSEMIASNLSHDSHCEDEYWLGDGGARRIRALGLDFIDRQYDVFTLIDPKNPNKGKKKTGVRTERFVQYPNGKKGLIPNIEMKLLGARKATKKLMKKETDPFKISILDGLQLAYKVTANSLYGQIGASTSKIFKKAIAASTTAGGRECIYRAKDYCLKNNPGCEVVYGDTDSVFVKFNLVYPDGSYPQTDQEKVQRSIDIGLELQDKLKKDKYFKPPHDLEYEKVFYPLMLITKKRYAGEKFEFDATKSKFTSMGIVLKRRDNAPILKHTYGGVMKKIMKEKNIQSAIDFVKLCCQEIIDNKYELNMFVISKTLSDYYKDPDSIPHKVLANRMTERDPGNKPASNERIPYAYIKVDEKPGEKLLQGDRIEHVNYITEHNLKLDYYIYIKNQLLKPICQIFELVVESMEGFPYQQDYFDNLYDVYFDKYKHDQKKTEKKISALKQNVVAKLIFEEYMVKAINIQNKVNTLDSWMVEEAKITEISNEEEKVEKEETEPIKKLKQSKQHKKPKKQTNISDFF